MPASLVITHDNSQFVETAVAALRADGHDVIGFTDSMLALDALEAAQRVEILIAAVESPEGQPNGISLGLMARMKRPGVRVLFIGGAEAMKHTEGVGELLVDPVTAATIVAMVRRMLAKQQGNCGAAN